MKSTVDEFCMCIKRNKLLIHAIIWPNFKCMLLSERSKAESLHVRGFHSYDILKKADL